jgi:hypothetical protein
MSKCDVRIVFDREDRTYRGGEEVSGTVVLTIRESFRCKGVTLTSFWRTHGTADRDTGPERKQSLLEATDLEPGEDLELPFTISAELWPPTYRGKTINLDHYLLARVDVPWAKDLTVEEDYLVVPGDEPEAIPDLKGVPESFETDGRSTGADIARRLIGWGFTLSCLGWTGWSIAGKAPGVPIVVAIISGVIGLIALVVMVHGILIRRRYGAVEVRVSPCRIAPGGELAVELRFQPRGSFTINSVSATLLAQESATYTVGTNTSTTKTPASETKVLKHEGHYTSDGETLELVDTLRVPEYPLHSFATKRSTLSWSLELRIDVPGYPDWTQSIPLLCLPDWDGDRPAS